jgi:hypothetical protein
VREHSFHTGPQKVLFLRGKTVLHNITAIRDGKPKTFQVEAKTPQDALVFWRTSNASRGCTRAAVGAAPASLDPHVGDDDLLSLADGLRDADQPTELDPALTQALRDQLQKAIPCLIPADGYEHSVCRSCGVATSTIKGADYLRKCSVHHRGCPNVKPGDLVVEPVAVGG